jgi:hypothetical protein
LFSPGIPVPSTSKTDRHDIIENLMIVEISSSNKTDRHNIAEILLKAALSTITLTLTTKKTNLLHLLIPR